MWPEPDEPSAVRRMHTAHARACSALSLVPTPGGPEAWGWQGRTLGNPVTDLNGPAWLRIACAPADQIVDTFWNGGAEAQQLIPLSIPRPRLHRWLDWSENGWAYRAELHEYVAVRPVTPHAVITAAPDLPPGWWSALRVALDTVVTVNTLRMTVQPGFLARAMPHYLGVSPSDANSTWTTAHGDLHFANLCAPELRILDWEGWGLAPSSGSTPAAPRSTHRRYGTA